MARTTPLRELLRSLMLGVDPRGMRRPEQTPSFGVHVEARGTVVAVSDQSGIFDVEVDGLWAVTDLDADGIPVSSQSFAGTASIALGAEWGDQLSAGSAIIATSTSTFSGLTTTLERLG